jgi:alpha-L-fucosidase
MIHRLSHLLLFATLFASSFLVRAQSLDQPREPAGARPSAEAISEWKDHKFGMFIHFGLYSTLGGVWQGKEVTNGYSEQIMSHAPISREDYAALAKSFNPTAFDAEAIVRLAQDAGMKFIVITSKHHDGFNMFHTRLTDYNIVDATPYGKDVVKELAEACARHGMKFGVYYSSIDWHYPGATFYETDNDRNNNVIPKAHEDFSVGQLKELTANYGPLSEIWFDMGKPTPAQSKRFADTVHANQPNCMVSGRVFNYEGDFTVMGDNQVPDFILDEPWQSPASIYPDTWGYRSWAARDDLPAKINEHILRLVQVVSRGGNYILNIGPQGDGSIVPFESSVLAGVGKWVKVNGEAIYGTQPQPFRTLPFGYATVKPGRLYLFVKNWPEDGRVLLPGLDTKISKAYLIADTQHTPLRIENTGTDKVIHLTGPQRTAPLTVIVAEYQGKMNVIPTTTKPNRDGMILLENKNADSFYNYNGYGYEDPPTIYKLQWAIAGTQPGRYKVDIFYRKPTAPSTADLLIGQQRETVALDANQAASTDASIFKTSTEVVISKPSAYEWVKITPQEPFIKGTKLGAEILRVELSPVQ